MNGTDLNVLEQVAIDELIDQVDGWSKSRSKPAGKGYAKPDDQQFHRYRALERLEGLGLVTKTKHHAPGGEKVVITAAGVEALAYLSTIP
ncbi:hypothetical protein SAMN06265360_1522 [Haloechinothrix alba]|uniref:Uncharacterized protein n=1 Tax=Haloechinothrix alba TaxID=664784 RepID=A0A239APF8_9PSEU|nr:hypothetical protein [Haloechinothrix alba]SNR97545.1 hypothetical protein SAMN06265360_1522 [Haloechinothrix alba]